MQRYKIIHRTYYNYFEEVTLGPHKLHLRPREDHELRIESFTLHISSLANLLWHRDVEGNSVCLANFDTPTSHLSVESDVVIQQFNETPFGFLVADYARDYPFCYQADEKILLSPYMALTNSETFENINRWIANFLQISESIQTYTLLQRLTEYIFQTLSYRIRE